MKKSPGRPAVELGLAKVRYEQGEYDSADEIYRELCVQKPELADRYSYLAMNRNESSRASGAGSSTDLLWEEEPEEE